MTIEKRKVTVTIRGRRFPLMTDADSSRIERVVDLVEGKLAELASHERVRIPASGEDQYRLAILAMLNLADENISWQQQLEEINGKNNRLLKELEEFKL